VEKEDPTDEHSLPEPALGVGQENLRLEFGREISRRARGGRRGKNGVLRIFEYKNPQHNLP